MFQLQPRCFGGRHSSASKLTQRRIVLNRLAERQTLTIGKDFLIILTGRENDSPAALQGSGFDDLSRHMPLSFPLDEGELGQAAEVQ